MWYWDVEFVFNGYLFYVDKFMDVDVYKGMDRC